MKKSYKINYWKCFWATFKDTLQCWKDLLDNDYLGIILHNAIFYITIVMCFPIFLVLTLVWYIKRIVLIKKAKDRCAIQSMVNQGYVRHLSKDEQSAIYEKKVVRQEKAIQTEKSKKLFNRGDLLYTVQGKSKVIKFYVDRIAFKIYKGANNTKVAVREYWCNCGLHKLPQSKHFGMWRCRHNHNLFKHESDAIAYLETIRRK